MDAALQAMLHLDGARFPNPFLAPADAPLCAGGDLEPLTLLGAYARGIFPWYEEGQPILWWSPDPRCVLHLKDFRLPARSARHLRQKPFQLSLNRNFKAVICSCAAPRRAEPGTWLSREMREAYQRLHGIGFAHSIEAWRDGALVGGLYGLCLGRVFFGESMFHRESEASRAALAALVFLLRGIGAHFLDCQQATAHILGMGACNMPRKVFLTELAKELATEPANFSGAAPDWSARWLNWDEIAKSIKKAGDDKPCI